MSFEPVNLVLLSVEPLDVQPKDLPRWWGYLTTDSIATVSAAGYFNIAPYDLLQNVKFNIGDIIYCVCSDGNIQLTLTAVGVSGTTATASAVDPGSVDTASIQNLAVTTAKLADGAVTNLKVDAAAAIAFSKLATLTSGQILVGSAANVATAVAMSGDVGIINTGATTIQPNAITTAKITNANVTLAKLSAGITPSHVVKFAGQNTTVGGAAAEAFAIPGVLATDLAFVQMVAQGTGVVTALIAVCTVDTLTVTFSANPQNDAIFNYQILRAAV